MGDRRALFVTPQPFFTERGSPYRVRAEIQAIVAHGIDVDLLSYPLGRDIELPGVRIFRGAVPFRCDDVPIGWSWRKVCLDVFLFLRAFGLVLRSIFSGERYVLLHGVEEAGVMVAIIGALFRIPFVFDMHSHMSEQLSQCVIRPGGILYRMMCRIEQWSMRRAAGVITVSDVITARVREIAPHVPALTLEDLALDASSPEPDRIHGLRSELRIIDRRVLLYTGNFEPYQGIDLLLDGYSRYARRILDAAVENGGAAHAAPAALVIVGGGREDDPRFQRYRGLVGELAIAEHVVFAGQRTEEEMGIFMAMADLLVSPRIAGAHTPLKIYSYMAARKPIVATRIPAHTNVLAGDNAFLADPDAESFAETLRTALIELSELSHAVDARVANASALLEQRFSRREFHRRMGVLYRAALGEQQSPELLMSPEHLRLRAGQHG